jgi:geranylgeranylglycerol-phosphate geranylgeranyltransferase
MFQFLKFSKIFSYLNEWAKLTRIEHAFFSIFGVLVGILIALKEGFNFSDYLLAFFVPFFINLGSFILNDYFDIAADKLNNRLDRPLVSGKINKKVALFVAILFFLIGLLAAYLLGWEPFLIALIFSILAIAYNYKLKEIAFFGNLIIALSMAIAFIFGYIVARHSFNFPNYVLILFFGALFIGLARELIKTIQDIKGDKLARGAKTLPILIGKKPSAYLAAFFFILFCFCVLLLISLTFNQNIFNWNYFSLGLIYLSLAISLILIIKTIKLEDLEDIRKNSLLLIGFLLAALIIALVVV